MRRAFERAAEQGDLPILGRLEGVGIAASESEGFVRLILETEVTQRCVKRAVEVLELAGQDTPGVLAAIDSMSPQELDALAELAHHASAAGVMEGFIIGVAYVAERLGTRRSMRDSRPGR
jgi:hypothetical protein